jgi:hypothetical protein
MRVDIGPYVKWWGPHQVADLIPFINKDTKNRLGEWLSKTWVGDLLSRIHEKRKRRIKVRIDEYDTWNMDHTLAYIILPMLKQLRETKHGSALVEDEDVPEHMRHTFSKGPDDYETDDPWVHYKWDWVMNEMIWAFEQQMDDLAIGQFYHGEPDIEWVDFPDSEFSEMKQRNPDYWVDSEGLKAYNERIDNGFRLFGKYLRGLWD